MQEKQREKTVPKEPEPSSVEDEQIAQLLQIGTQADEQLLKLLQKKKKNKRRKGLFLKSPQLKRQLHLS